MFILSEMRNVVRITPDLFNLKLSEAVARELNKKLANKVVLNVGLCICLFDITKLEESYILPGDGASHTRVTFRYVVFRPFVEEILLGKIRSCNQEGVHGERYLLSNNSNEFLLFPQSRWDSSTTSSSRRVPSNIPRGSTKWNKLGFGSMTRATGTNTTYSWTLGRRSGLKLRQKRSKKPARPVPLREILLCQKTTKTRKTKFLILLRYVSFRRYVSFSLHKVYFVGEYQRTRPRTPNLVG